MMKIRNANARGILLYSHERRPRSWIVYMIRIYDAKPAEKLLTSIRKVRQSLDTSLLWSLLPSNLILRTAALRKGLAAFGYLKTM